MLKSYILVDLAQQYCELLEEGHTNEMAFDTIKEILRNDFDGEIWELVDDEENSLELDFDDFLSDIMDDISIRANDHFENK